MRNFRTDLTIGIAASLALHAAILVIPLSRADSLGGFFGDSLSLNLIQKARGVIGSKEDRQGGLKEHEKESNAEDQEKEIEKRKVKAHLNSPPVVKEQVEKKKKIVRTTAAGARAGSDTSAAPTVESAHSRLSGLGWSNKQASYLELLVAWIDRHKRYPFAAERSGTEGQVFVSLNLDTSGDVLTTSVLNGSGNKLLDTEAINMIKRASPLPKPPRGMSTAQLKFVIPIEFSLGRR